MAVKNISGTTVPSFKIGCGGVKLISKAVKGDDLKTVTKFHVKDSEGTHEVAYKSDIERMYDTFVSSAEIKSLVYTSSTLKIVLKEPDENGNTEIEISKLINTNDILTPDEPTEIGEVIVFGSTNGKALAKSGMKITNNPDDIEARDNVIPSSVAVRGYLVRPLEARLDGKGVSNKD